MYNFDKNAFRRYFFDGEENPDGALEGIIFHVYTEIISEKEKEEIQDDEYWIRKFEKLAGQKEQVRKEALEEQGEIAENEIGNFWEKDSQEIKRKITMFINEVEPVYKQYYRFIELNNKPGVYNYKDLPPDDLNSQTETNHELIKKKQLKKRIGETIRRLRNEGKINITEEGIFYSIDQIKKYSHFMEGTISVEQWQREDRYKPFTIYNQEDWKTKKIPKNMNTWYTMQAEGEENIELDKNACIPYQLEHWTKALSKVLVSLCQIEKQDPKAYLDLWIRTRLKRAKSTKHPIQGIQPKELQRLEYICKEIRNARLAKQNKSKTEEEKERD